MYRIIIAAALAASTTALSPMSFAEESPAFAARFAALQDSATSSVSERAATSQHTAASQPAETQPEKDS
ncbi:hypothetical protein CH92_11255 [Stutzerimonas stutzeri]|uniref:Uncharacterized protein n=1 Tax=Stutzerimonas stutzeri TaxID=316 RepID=W8RD24_STUST|nr:hypothetical protein [Stutzerimonas stutzeri]AHL77648.1 hypothetical protein CH92_11255 [Stutzerimonas stutzeri]MCQ4327770.1 hypothetical protein [Stutzerimonas stutzeri]